MEVYACGFIDDVDYQRYSIRTRETHRQSMIITLEKLLNMYEFVLFCLES
jgi:hypothetical protein